MEIAVYRILGNDLPPRHGVGQTCRNTEFILRNEQELPFARRRWIVNRIVDPQRRVQLIALLRAHRQRYLEIPFSLDEYRACAGAPLHDERILERVGDPDERARHNRILYAMNVNGARNAALDAGRKSSDWVLPLYGNCFFTPAGWEAIRRGLQQQRPDRHFLIPMYRLTGNEHIRDFDPARHAEHEPQVIFGRATTSRFHPEFRYGWDSKIELIRRLGLSLGVTDNGVVASAPEERLGFVLRLFSGVEAGEADVASRTQLRDAGIDGLLQAAAVRCATPPSHGRWLSPTRVWHAVSRRRSG